MKFQAWIGVFCVACGGFTYVEPTPEGEGTPEKVHCDGWCTGLRTCEGATDASCETDCYELLADADQFRVSGLTASGMECVSMAVGCDAIETCGL